MGLEFGRQEKPRQFLCSQFLTAIFCVTSLFLNFSVNADSQSKPIESVCDLPPKVLNVVVGRDVWRTCEMFDLQKEMSKEISFYIEDVEQLKTIVKELSPLKFTSVKLNFTKSMVLPSEILSSLDHVKYLYMYFYKPSSFEPKSVSGLSKLSLLDIVSVNHIAIDTDVIRDNETLLSIRLSSSASLEIADGAFSELSALNNLTIFSGELRNTNRAAFIGVLNISGIGIEFDLSDQEAGTWD